MSLNKRTYVDQETVITAENLNDIQDEIILNGQNIGKHAGVFAPPYDDTATYALGAYCTYNNQMYKCTTAIATPEDWTGEHWTTVTIGNELSTKEENVQSDWNQVDSTKDDFIKNKPTIPAAQIQSDWDQSDTTAEDFIKNKPTIPAAQIQSDWDQSDTNAKDFIKNKAGYQANEHVMEFLNAVRENREANTGFDYSIPLAQTVLLGNVAARAGKKGLALVGAFLGFT